ALRRSTRRTAATRKGGGSRRRRAARGGGSEVTRPASRGAGCPVPRPGWARRAGLAVRPLSAGRPAWQGVRVTTEQSSSRRIGAPDSKTRTRLLDAAERLLLREGYASVTSRRVAAEAGLKPQLVHYYFRTMDDLFLEVFR